MSFFSVPGALLARARSAAGVLHHRRTSALVILASEAESLVEEWRGRVNPSSSVGVPAHLTVMYPFLHPSRLGESTHAAITRAAATVPAFDYSLRTIDRFPDVVYLAPDVTAPFVELLRAVQREWPGLQPYGGRFTEFTPHLTVVEGPEPEGLVRALEDALPIHAHARELVLMAEVKPHRWALAARYPLR